MKFAIIGYYILINFLTLYLFAKDKKRYNAGVYRVPEATMVLTSLLGGCFAAFLVTKIGHHNKSKRFKFKVLVPLFVLIHIALLIYIFKVIV